MIREAYGTIQYSYKRWAGMILGAGIQVHLLGRSKKQVIFLLNNRVIFSRDCKKLPALYTGVDPLLIPYTAYMHKELVASLSCRGHTQMQDYIRRQNQEPAKINSQYYITEQLNKNPSLVSPIFHYHPPFINLFQKTIHRKPFEFAGYTSHMDHVKARDDIVNGNYIRCVRAVALKDPKSKRLENVDLVLTGTTDQRKCRQFTSLMLQEFNASNQNYPYAY